MRVFQHSFKNKESSARFFGKIAIKALYDELALYPKPGLVSFIDNGAHHDMDGKLFYKSIFSLRHYFIDISLLAMQGQSPHKLCELGQEAEKTMNQITGGINTHRGAIFSLGILCATLAKLSVNNQKFSIHELQKNIVNDWADYLLRSHRSSNTNSAIVRKKYGIAGAKKMAITGYKPVFDIFHSLCSNRYTHKTYFGISAYKQLLLSIDDSNVLYSHGPKGLQFARESINDICCSADKDNAILETVDLHKLFVRENISPGCVADMLSLMFYLRYIFAELKT